VKEKTLRWAIGLLGAGQVLAWSFNYIAGKIALRHLDALTLVSFRLVLSGAIYLVLWLGSGARGRVAWKDAPVLGLLGLFGVVMNQGAFTVALDYTSVGHVAIITAAGPVLVLLLARALGQERLSPAKVLGVVLAFSGIALLAIEQGLRLRTGRLAGDLIALCGATGFALFTVFSKQVRHRYDSIAFNTFIHLTGAVAMLPLAIGRGVALDWGRVGWAGWAAMAYMSVFASVFGYLIFYKLLAHLSATQVSSFNYLLPIVATTLGVTLLGEEPGAGFFAAAALVLTGVGLTQRARWQIPPAD